MKIRLKPILRLKTTLAIRVVILSSILFVVASSIILLYTILGSSKTAEAETEMIEAESETTAQLILKSFSAELKDNVIKLLWTTSYEINNDYFTLERSRDGIIYTPIAKINGSGSSTTDNNYSYADDGTLNNDNYYRLCQTSYNGRTEVFGPFHVKLNQMFWKNSMTGTEPAVFNDHLTINYSVKTAGIIKLDVISASGKIIFSEMVVSGEGNNSHALNDLSSLPQGMYFIRMTTQDDVQSMKVLKQG